MPSHCVLIVQDILEGLYKTVNVAFILISKMIVLSHMCDLILNVRCPYLVLLSY